MMSGPRRCLPTAVSRGGRLGRALRAGLTVLLLVAASACSSSPERPDPGPGPEQFTEPLDLEEPTPTELADSPCGNPDWTRLPDGSAPPAAPPATPPPAPEGGETGGETGAD